MVDLTAHASTYRNITLTIEQELAVSHSVDESIPLYAITGGAGTGKTTILRYIYEQLKNTRGTNIVLCAPTGRAAKRIQEATGIPAKTIHRLLQFPHPSDDDTELVGLSDEGFNTYGPRRNRSNPLSERIVLVDEASMIGPILDKQLRDALPPSGLIRYFGDANQLPPVEEGTAPFRALVKSRHAITLTQNFRSDDEIIGNAERILHGRIPNRNSRFEIIYTEEPVRELVSIIDEPFTRPEHQVLMTMRKGMFGTTRVNPSLQIKFNPSGPYLKIDRPSKEEHPLTVKTRDKFIWTKNDYGFNLFNGDIGVIEGVDEEDGTINLGLSDRPTLSIPARAIGRGSYGPYHYDPRKQIDLGYAITTHKAQGSEFDTIVYVMTSKGQGGAYMCSRNNFYTGITRARKNVVVICDRRAMQLSVRKVV